MLIFQLVIGTVKSYVLQSITDLGQRPLLAAGVWQQVVADNGVLVGITVQVAG